VTCGRYKTGRKNVPVLFHYLSGLFVGDFPPGDGARDLAGEGLKFMDAIQVGLVLVPSGEGRIAEIITEIDSLHFLLRRQPEKSTF